ncbi:MAG: hypothetical protein LQ350_003084 [Teloschistes chrysophthalmus]|nr:MAG: hypothetical protein LQ350_003084 [Niorma chrysophthalma]
MRSLRSFLRLGSALLLSPVTGSPQAPALLATVGDGQGAAATAVADCNGCQIIVDVAGVVWYSEVFLNTAATVVNSVNNGNGSRVTRTSTIINSGQFTFNPAAGTAAFGATPLAVTNVAYGSVTTIGGVPLTSPTAYNVFTAYTLSSQFVANGVCSSTTYVSTLPQAFTETLPQGGGQVTLDAAGEQQFITGVLGFSTCSNGGANIAASVLAPVSNITATTTMFGSGVALAAMTTMTLAPTTNPTSSLPLRTTTLVDVLTTLTATLRGSSTITPSASFTGSANAPNIVIGNLTITPNGNPIGLPFIPANATAITVSTAPGASGTGIVVTGNFTGNTTGNTTVPFVGDAYSWRSGTSLWGSCLLVFLLAIGWIL